MAGGNSPTTVPVANCRGARCADSHGSFRGEDPTTTVFCPRSRRLSGGLINHALGGQKSEWAQMRCNCGQTELLGQIPRTPVSHHEQRASGVWRRRPLRGRSGPASALGRNRSEDRSARLGMSASRGCNSGTGPPEWLAIRWSDGLAAALVGAGRTTEQVHSGTISTFEERLETFFDEFRRWCTQVEERPEHRDGDPHSLR